MSARLRAQEICAQRNLTVVGDLSTRLHSKGPPGLKWEGATERNVALHVVSGDDQHFLLKCSSDYAIKGAAREFRGVTALHEEQRSLGAIIPEPVELWEGCALYRFLDAEPLGDRYLWHHPQEIGVVTPIFINFIERLQTLTLPEDSLAAPMSKRIITDVHAAYNCLRRLQPYIEERTYSVLEGTLDLYKVWRRNIHLVPSHCDINVSHIMRRADGHLVIIDWEWLSLNHPEGDILAYYSTSLNRHRTQKEIKRHLIDAESVLLLGVKVTFALHYLRTHHSESISNKYEAAIQRVLTPHL